MSDKLYLTKVLLADGNTYHIKDEEARELIAQGIKIEIPANGTLPTASADTMGKFYFIPVNPAGGVNDGYDEFITVKSDDETPVYTWEKIGNARLDLSGYSLKTHTHTVSSTTKYLHKVSMPKTFSNQSVVTGISKSKLVTTSVTGVSGSTTASKATASSAVAVATTDTAVSVPNVTGNVAAEVTVTPATANRATGALGSETTTRGADTVMWGASVDSNGCLSFSYKPMTTASTVTGITSATTDATKTTLGTALSITPAKSNGTITPYTFADVTVPVAANAATTVATGALNAEGAGAEIATGASGTENVLKSVATTGDVYDTINTTATGGDAFVESVTSPTGQASA